MKLSFYGAAQMVTGSCFLAETKGKKFLIDCGMFQGGKELDELNYKEFPFSPGSIDFMLLTHAHIDHSGRIPKLCKEGFVGEIYTNHATVELCDIMLQDSGHIQEMESEWKNRKRIRKGLEELEPMYTVSDAVHSMKQFVGVDYRQEIKIDDDLKIRFINSGHMLGSSFVEIKVYENERWNVYLFTGDIGNTNIPLLKDPATVDEVDYLIIESTYGDRMHKNGIGRGDDLLSIIKKTAARGGNIVIPSFAVGRTQEVLFDINRYKEKGLLGQFDKIPVYVDSPLAIKATEIFRRNCELFDKETRTMIAKGDDPLLFENLHFTLTSDESKQINADNKSKVIISASGMCEAGRIKHHLKHNLWRRESSVVFVGYQAPGTLGHTLKTGARKVRIFGEEIAVKSKIYSVEGFSSHADLDGLVKWIDSNGKLPDKIILIHGEKEGMEKLKNTLTDKFGKEVLIPEMGDTVELTYSREVIDHQELISMEEASKEKMLAELYDLIESVEKGHVKNVDKAMEDIKKLKELIS